MRKLGTNKIKLKERTEKIRSLFSLLHVGKVFLIIMILVINLIGNLAFAKTKEKTVNVKYFFPKSGTQNLTSNPNWFYYWNQVCGDVNAVYKSGLAYYGTFDPGTSTTDINIGPPASGNNNTTGHSGIDCYCETIIHEGTHRTHYNETHGAGAQTDTDGDWLKDTDETNGDLNLNGTLDSEDKDGDGKLDVNEDTNGNGTLDPGEDKDGDGNLDVNEDVGLVRIELTLTEYNASQSPRNVTYGAGNGVIDRETGTIGGTSIYHANSAGGPYDDEDDTCYAAESSWAAGSVDNQDWAHPGKQWP